VLGIAGGIPLFVNYFTEGTDSIIRLIKAILRYRDFAVRYHSHGYYNNFNPPPSTFRHAIDKQMYVNPDIAQFDGNKQINNLFRNRTVALKTATNITNPGTYAGSKQDLTRYDSTKLSNTFWPI